MLKTRMKRVADRGDHAVRLLAEIEASIADLSNEDLLDLADIFKAKPAHQSGIWHSLKWRGGILVFRDRSGRINMIMGLPRSIGCLKDLPQFCMIINGATT